MTVSSKARGKQRAIDQDAPAEQLADAQEEHMELDLDLEGDDDEDEVAAGLLLARNGTGKRERHRQSQRKRAKQRIGNTSSSGDDEEEEKDGHRDELLSLDGGAGSNAETSAVAAEKELGGSISRAARMRATSTADEGGSSSESDSDSDSNDDDDVPVPTPSKSQSKSGRKAPSKPFVTASSGEAYLRAMSQPARTSNARLSERWAEPFTQASLLAALPPSSHSKLDQLEGAYAGLRAQWAFELEQGFTVLLYGLGSKIRVLDAFVRQHLQRRRTRGKVVVVHGFVAALGVDDILAALEAAVLDRTEDELALLKLSRSAAKLDERTQTIVEQLRSSPRILYLIVHNIDSLRSFRAQATLSLLAPHVRLLASIDHVKAPLLFPASLANNRSAESAGYKILYHHVPTYRPYTVESLLSGTFQSLFLAALFASEASANGGPNTVVSSAARAKAASFVLASLTQKAKDVFVLLAERQMGLSRSKTKTSLSADKTPPYATLYATLFSLARDAFLANNANQFEALLREFRDHSVILSSSTRPEGEGAEDDGQHEEEVGQRAGEWVWIAIDREDLAELVERIKQGH